MSKDGMSYEEIPFKIRRVTEKRAKDMLSKRDNAVLDKMSSYTIIEHLYHKHSTGVWIVLAILGWTAGFIMFLGA